MLEKLKSLLVRSGLLLGVLAGIFETKVFERCEFVNYILESGQVKIDDLVKWTCVAAWASNFNASKEIYLENGTTRYGILQIDNLYGCGPPESDFAWCKIECKELLNDNLRDDLECGNLLTYFIGHDGFEGWPEWDEHCKGHDLSNYTEGCFEDRIPRIDSPQGLVINRGGVNETINCTVTGEGRLSLKWKYNKRLFQGVHEQVLRSDTDPKILIMCLVLPLVDFVESSEVTCSASNDYGETNKSFLVEVMGFPEITSPTDVEFRLIFENQSLPCQGTGYPAPVLKWNYDEDAFPGITTRLDEELVDSMTVSLVFPTITFDIAQFNCEATNKFGNVTQIFHVTVLEPPTVATPTQQTFYTGDVDKYITCSALGLPMPQIKWEFNEALHTNVYPGEDSVDEETFTRSLRLVFPTLDFTEEQFVCIAFDGDKQDSQTFYVNVVDGPEADKLPYEVYVPIIVVAAAVIVSVSILWYRKLILPSDGLTKEEIERFRTGIPCKIQEYLYRGNKEPLRADLFSYLPYDKNFELKYSNLEIHVDEVLGTGNYGVVFKGDYNGKIVAVKVPKNQNKTSNIKALLTEIKVMIHIGEHLHVVNLIGAKTSDLRKGELCVAVDYCEFGDLEAYLRSRKQYFVDPSLPEGYISGGYLSSENNKNDTISFLDLITWSSQIAAGMAHLEERKVVHGDLASRNVLLYSKNIAKISDFGLAKKLYSQLEYVSQAETQILPWRWMAIEALTSFSFCSKSDTWSFGVTLWEIFNLGEVPYPGLLWSQDFPVLLQQGMRLTKPKYASQEIYETMLSCWELDHRNRPDFPSLLTTLLALKRDIEFPLWSANIVSTDTELCSNDTSVSQESESK